MPRPDVIPDSTYPVLEKPEFHSQIPEHLLAGASDAEKHIMSQLSIMTSFAEWSVRAHMSTNEQVRRTNGRLIKAEGNIGDIKEDKRFLRSGWKAIVVVAGVISGLVSFLALLWQTFGGK